MKSEIKNTPTYYILKAAVEIWQHHKQYQQ
jgi:hypothetical protein